MVTSPLHSLTISFHAGERHFDYSCPDDCNGGDHCATIGTLRDRLFELTDDLPDGEYGFESRTLWNHDISVTLTLPTGEIVPALTGAPSGCQHCGIPQRDHGRQHQDVVGWHAWHAPTTEQIKFRMRARRAITR